MSIDDAQLTDALIALHAGLDRQGPDDDAFTRGVLSPTS